MKNKKIIQKDKKTTQKDKNGIKKDNLLKFFVAGILAAVCLFVIFKLLNDDRDDGQVKTVQSYEWSPEMDSMFIKDCYEKYKPQIKDDFQKQENVRVFCRCMLEKVKTKYDEKEVGRVATRDIQQWDAECREEILNPNNIKDK